jgi:hypothetical protein
LAWNAKKAIILSGLDLASGEGSGFLRNCGPIGRRGCEIPKARSGPEKLDADFGGAGAFGGNAGHAARTLLLSTRIFQDEDLADGDTRSKEKEPAVGVRKNGAGLLVEGDAAAALTIHNDRNF